MNRIFNVILSVTMLSLSLTIMQTNAANQTVTQKTTPYGDNPNIFRVLAYKTGDTVQHSAEQLGHATEKEMDKIKPKVTQTWENTKTYTADKTQLAKQNTQKGINKAVEKMTETKDAIIGTTTTPVPIERGRLSQTSTENNSSQIQNNLTPTATIHADAVIVTQSASLSQTASAQEPHSITQQPLASHSPSNSANKNLDDDASLPR